MSELRLATGSFWAMLNEAGDGRARQPCLVAHVQPRVMDAAGDTERDLNRVVLSTGNREPAPSGLVTLSSSTIHATRPVTLVSEQ